MTNTTAVPLHLASASDQPVAEAQRKFSWPQEPHPAAHSDLTDLDQ